MTNDVIFEGKDYRNAMASLYKEGQRNINPYKTYRIALPVEIVDKRSLDSNAYSWVLTDKIASELEKRGKVLPRGEIHERMIFKYGQPLFDGTGQRVVLNSKKDVSIASLLIGSNLYAKPIKQFKEGDEMFISWQIYRGTSDYSTREMVKFIDGLVDEAKQLGIDTTPPKDFALLVENTKSIMPAYINSIGPMYYSNGYIKGWRKFYIFDGEYRRNAELFGCFCWLRSDYKMEPETLTSLQWECRKAFIENVSKNEEGFEVVFGDLTVLGEGSRTNDSQFKQKRRKKNG